MDSGDLSFNGNGQRGQFLIDLFVDPGARETSCHTDGIFDGIRVRAAVANDGHAAHAQQRGAPIFGIVDALAKLCVSAAREHVAHLRSDGAFKRFLQ